VWREWKITDYTDITDQVPLKLLGEKSQAGGPESATKVPEPFR
jgi:hypothetical protein